MTEFERFTRIYVDTNIWIYYLEANEAFGQKVDAVLDRANDANATLVTSEIAVAECLVQPSRKKNAAAIALYEEFFDEGSVEITKLDGALARRAALASRELGLKLIDSIHYLSAREAGCAYLLTADTRFKSTDSITVIGLD